MNQSWKYREKVVFKLKVYIKKKKLLTVYKGTQNPYHLTSHPTKKHASARTLVADWK